MSDYDVDFDDFAAFSPETPVKGPNLWLVQIAQNQQIKGHLRVELLRRSHLFFKKKGTTSWFRQEELVDDWLDLYSA